MLCYKHDYILIFLSISHGSNPLVIPPLKEELLAGGWLLRPLMKILEKGENSLIMPQFF